LIDLEFFAQHTRNALNNYYNTAHLQTNPLAKLLELEPAQGYTAAQSLRKLLREVIETLQPSPLLPPGSSEWLDYRVLWTRYIHAHSQVETCQELGISSSTYYRHHRCALEAVAHILWESYTSSTDAESDATARSESEGDQVVKEAIRLAHTSQRQVVNLNEFLEGIKETILPLVEQREMTLEIDATSPLPTVYLDPGLLSQILVNVLAEAVDLATGDGLELSIGVGEDETIWRLGQLDEARVSARDAEQDLALARALLNAYGGHLWFTSDQRGGAALTFTLPIGSPPLVLVIDDDADMARLCRIYLEGQGCLVRQIRSSEDLEAQLASALPALILLDILMPQWDGWSILRRLKTDPATAEVPVVICSVIRRPDLALTLGADRVLSKPITRASLVQTVREILSREGSQV